MSFAATFSNALSGISASTLRAEVLSFNIANAQTDHYSRRAVAFEPLVPGGVRALGISRAQAGAADADLIGAEARAQGAGVRAEAALAINRGFGDADDTNGLYAVFGRFEQALSDLRLTPESGSAQTALLRAAQDVAETFARLNADAQQMRLNADRAIGQTVGRINDALSQLSRLNADARRPRGINLDTVAERQRALVAEISREMDIRVDGKYGGELTIRTRGGYLLLGEEPAELSFTPSGSMSFNLSYANGDLSGLFVDGRDITPTMLQGVKEGGLAAQFAVRDSLVPDYATRLDALAQDLADRLAAADSTAVEGLFVLHAGLTSAAERLAVNAAVDPAQGGELFRLRDGVGAGAPGPAAGQGVLGEIEAALDALRPLTAATSDAGAYAFRDLLGAVATRLGTQALRADERREGAAEARTSIETEVTRLTGVDTDRELQDLLLVEQAFAANARVIRVADEMLRQLLEF